MEIVMFPEIVHWNEITSEEELLNLITVGRNRRNVDTG
jgi:hypothetical protein